MHKLILITLVGYLIGSIPFGLIVTRFVKGVDIREFGSGNIGATNAYRVMGFGMGLLVALLDIGKGAVAVYIAKLYSVSHYGEEVALFILVVGIAAIAGHNLSIFLKFKGGRGVATSVGVLGNLALLPIVITALLWITIILITKYVSLASITGAVAVPILMFLFSKPTEYVIFCLLISAFVIYSHRPNIKRLLNGNENKVEWHTTGKYDD